LAYASKQQRKARRQRKVKPTRLTPALREHIVEYLQTVAPAIQGEQGHDQLFKVCRDLRWGYNLNREVALELVLEHYKPPLPATLDGRPISRNRA
jgi:hypothetical protein